MVGYETHSYAPLKAYHSLLARKSFASLSTRSITPGSRMIDFMGRLCCVHMSFQ